MKISRLALVIFLAAYLIGFVFGLANGWSLQAIALGPLAAGGLIFLYVAVLRDFVRRQDARLRRRD
jgi:hypothetical protein